MKDNVRTTDKDVLRADVLRECRIARHETQTKFWRRFGVTQSRGSRFELGTEIPPSVAILIKLYFDGTVSDGDLWRARRAQPRGEARARPQHVRAD